MQYMAGLLFDTQTAKYFSIIFLMMQLNFVSHTDKQILISRLSLV